MLRGFFGSFDDLIFLDGDNGGGTGGAGGAGGASGGNDPQAETPPAGDPKPGESQADEPMSLEEAKKLRKEAQSLRGRLKTFEDAEATRKQEGMTEQQKLQVERDRLQVERDTLAGEIRTSKALAAAASAGALYPDMLAAKLDAALDLDDSKAVTTAFADLRKQYPALFRAANGSADGGAGNRTDMTTEATGVSRMRNAYADNSKKR